MILVNALPFSTAKSSGNDYSLTRRMISRNFVKVSARNFDVTRVRQNHMGSALVFCRLLARFAGSPRTRMMTYTLSEIILEYDPS